MINRRTFNRAVGLSTGAAAVSLSALQPNASAATGPAQPSSATVPIVTPGTHTGFGAIKQVKAGLLNVGYAEAGPAHGPVVLLLHGWPYDIHSFVDVAPLLADQGYRVIVPHLRGHGSTRFLSRHTPRTAEQSAVALDIVALMDALKIHKAVLAGFDWGSRTADIIAALWPERVKSLVSTGGYLITDRKAQLTPAIPAVEHNWWYQWYFATERGKETMEDVDKRIALCRYVWTLVSPNWNFDDATFARTAEAFKHPDYAAVVLYNYRWRIGLVEGEPRYDRYEKLLAAQPSIGVPTITLDAALDPFTAPGDGSAYRGHFTGAYEHRTIADIGHNLPQEAPSVFARAVIDADRL
ncbi:pimeloyl-ACP methyl ester carboxylesterase [Streptomyces sp. SAI-144]|uniref:alpha/beta fold hydrolase n=1 Tax=unclassified Streptomyces TaxID=2593676 RepID=UPI0024744C6C|nr:MULTISPECIES: alpha/beta hydrolase [unclassified Streptomyces]MDH6438078.1 pimeloyl-ACP methyl ester carboxylesterase [Streptomyces sp. SAI-144]MDH6485496.1 pimeloyl-ACP methyl ester carboxylesterase [Streptomyces sp. SAI-127]